MIGCEKNCIMFKGENPTACVLPEKYQNGCEGRQQFKAGIQEVIDYLEQYNISNRDSIITKYFVLDLIDWQTKKSEWGI